MPDHLSKDLIFEIFTRLPPKSLLRFQSLSKSLCSIISSPEFIQMHTFRSPQKLLITHREDNKQDFYTLHSQHQFPPCPIRGYFGILPVDIPYNKSSRIVGSCNGIICLTDDKNRNFITLWNPSIRHTLTLPRCPQVYTARVVFGFGFDPITDNYKIVSIYHPYSYVYTMKTGTWRAIISTPTPVFSLASSNACLVNGTLHWVVGNYFSKSNVVNINCIMTFDLSTNVFSVIELPDPEWRTVGLTTIQGSLAVISIKDGNIWMWVRRDATWSVVYKSDRKYRRIARVLQLSINGDMLFDVYNKGFQVYNHKIGEPTKLVGFKSGCQIVGMEWCVESLQLLDIGSACEENQPSLLNEKKWRNDSR